MVCAVIGIPERQDGCLRCKSLLLTGARPGEALALPGKTEQWMSPTIRDRKGVEYERQIPADALCLEFLSCRAAMNGVQAPGLTSPTRSTSSAASAITRPGALAAFAGDAAQVSKVRPVDDPDEAAPPRLHSREP